MNNLRYEKPQNATQACQLLADEKNRARVLAGGTDLLIELRYRGNDDVGMLVDIKSIEAIDQINWRNDGSVEIGACVTMKTIEESEEIRKYYPALVEGAQTVGSKQVRARATLAGNLCNASPCMDTAPPLIALNASLKIARASGDEKNILLKDFFLGVKRTTLAPGEIVRAIVLPAEAKQLRSAFEKITRVNGHDLALVNAAGTYDPDRKVLRAVIGSCAITPILTPDLSSIEPTQNIDEVAQRLANLALEHVSPISDVRSSKEYRLAMVEHLCKRLVKRLLKQ